MKLVALGSGDHGEDLWPTCHKVSVSSLAMAWFIGSKSTLVLSQISVWWLLISFSGAAVVAAQEDGGRCFDEARDSPKVEL
jgi:hypothetical protein